MPSLAELQKSFVRAILSDNPGDGRLPSTGGPISATAALGVHRNTVLAGLANALKLTYPTVVALVGEPFFMQATLAYVAARTPIVRVDLYGSCFPGFLAEYEPVKNLAHLVDVARLDQAIDRALFGPDETCRRTWAIDDRVQLSLPANLAVLQVEHPADVIRETLEAEDYEALPDIDLPTAPRWLAVWRSGAVAVVRRLDPAAGAFLSATLAGAAPDDALAAATEVCDVEQALAAIQTDVFAAPFARVQPFEDLAHD